MRCFVKVFITFFYWIIVFIPLLKSNPQLNKSEGGTVYISETSARTSGNYKCEISVEGTFQTVAAEKLMTVEGMY